MTREFNFDGLVGPSHHYAGLSFGNLASAAYAHTLANPKQAALQGLEKMRALAARGFAQAVLPPQPRPNLGLLRSVGFSGDTAQLLSAVHWDAPTLLGAAYSSSAMWTANAATVSPSADTADGRVHFTAANLNSKLHRSYEHIYTAHVLRTLFADPRHFVVHDALPSTPAFGDEGAANHTRLCTEYGAAGVELFVYGRSEFSSAPLPQLFPARQTLEASQAVARLHGLRAERTVFAQQNPAVIDAGGFHNDVIAVGNANVLFYHEAAFVDKTQTLATLEAAMAEVGATLQPICVTSDEVPLADAVSSYLFNSQLLCKPNGRMLLVTPQECQQNAAVARYLENLLASNSAIDELLSFDLHQSMRNGGGPACLRLRVALTETQAAAMHQGVIFTDALDKQLVQWVEKHYRDQLSLADLADPALMGEIQTAMEELAGILGLPAPAPFTDFEKLAG